MQISEQLREIYVSSLVYVHAINILRVFNGAKAPAQFAYCNHVYQYIRFCPYKPELFESLFYETQFHMHLHRAVWWDGQRRLYRTTHLHAE